ncbi:MAG: hypothetical protein C0154_09785 [Mucilaginibacter sp.]|nr:MAG: hypothetical protein BGO48_10360 [Mucilaginibacter sp. 44-25]PLW89784.1 MAG: hypothetical protein C0154_09785 [Mucilaginibacter sp.]
MSERFITDKTKLPLLSKKAKHRCHSREITNQPIINCEAMLKTPLLFLTIPVLNLHENATSRKVVAEDI